MYYPDREMLSSFMDGTIDTSKCNVLIDEASLRVEYQEEGNSVFYSGAAEPGTKSYKTRKSDGSGYSTLHLDPDGKSLVGFWVEEGKEGFWKISLKGKL